MSDVHDEVDTNAAAARHKRLSVNNGGASPLPAQHMQGAQIHAGGHGHVSMQQMHHSSMVQQQGAAVGMAHMQQRPHSPQAQVGSTAVGLMADVSTAAGMPPAAPGGGGGSMQTDLVRQLAQLEKTNQVSAWHDCVGCGQSSCLPINQPEMRARP